MPVDLFQLYLDYRLLSCSSVIVEGSIIQLVRFDAWLATVLTCLEQFEHLARYGQELIADSYMSHVNEVVN